MNRSHDIYQCCSPELNGGGGWGIFNSLFGWQNSASYGSVISYNMYWIAVIVGFLALRFNEKHGRWPFMKAKAVPEDISRTASQSGSGSDGGLEKQAHTTNVKSAEPTTEIKV